MANWWDVVTDKFVRNVANRYMVDYGIEAFSVFPKLDTKETSGYIAKYNKDDWLRIGDTKNYKRMGAVESYGDDYDVDKQSYFLEEFAFHKDISKDDRNEYDNPYDPVNDATDFVMTRIRRVLLKNMVDTFFAASVWSGKSDQNLTSSKWSSKTSGTSNYDPVDTVSGWRDDIASTTGYWPNRMLVTPDVHTALKNNTFVTTRMKTTSDKVVTEDLLSKLFELNDYKVLRSINSAGSNFMKSGAVLLVYTPDRPSKFKPSAGYHLTYRGRDSENVMTKRLPMPALNDALRIEAALKVDPVVLATDLGMYAYNVV